MKILTAAQLRAADAHTIAHEPVASLALMERAATAFADWFLHRFAEAGPVAVVCGQGNNGGDGLAIARLLHQRGRRVSLWVVAHTGRPSPDFTANRHRLPAGLPVQEITGEEQVPAFGPADLVVDALFGTGLTRPAAGLAAAAIGAMNRAGTVVSVDVPSGLFADTPNLPADAVVRARHTVTFQLPKLAFMLPQPAACVGEWHRLDIGLHPDALAQADTPYHYTDEETARSLLRPRHKFAHKGTHGHALLWAGSPGMMGAAVLAARGCLRAGVGKLSVLAPESERFIVQVAVPEAMLQQPPGAWTADMLRRFSAIGIGPGLGAAGACRAVMRGWFGQWAGTPLVVDADGLNHLAAEPALLAALPPGAVLTPHPKEFQKLVGRPWADDYERLALLRQFAVAHRAVVCLKGAHTAVALPDGTVHFNATGNPGMATGGSGDVLTGILTALLAQQYAPREAALLGVYLHGLAGDAAAARKTVHALTASDLPEHLPEAFRRLGG